MDVYEDKLPPTSAVADRTNPRFFTQIYAEKTRSLVRRGVFFGLGNKFFATWFLCESIFFVAPLRG